MRDAKWIAQHVKAANQVFKPHGILLVPHVEHFSPEKCDFVGRRARNSLAPYAEKGKLTVLVLKRVQDLDLPSYNLMGVHWRYSGKDPQYRGRRWVILTSRAKTPVLAHELAHYFGLPHDAKGGNLMTPGPSAPKRKGRKKFKPILTSRQAKKLLRGVRQFLNN